MRNTFKVSFKRSVLSGKAGGPSIGKLSVSDAIFLAGAMMLRMIGPTLFFNKKIIIYSVKYHKPRRKEPEKGIHFMIPTYVYIFQKTKKQKNKKTVAFSRRLAIIKHRRSI